MLNKIKLFLKPFVDEMFLMRVFFVLSAALIFFAFLEFSLMIYFKYFY